MILGGIEYMDKKDICEVIEKTSFTLDNYVRYGLFPKPHLRYGRKLYWQKEVVTAVLAENRPMRRRDPIYMDGAELAKILNTSYANVQQKAKLTLKPGYKGAFLKPDHEHPFRWIRSRVSDWISKEEEEEEEEICSIVGCKNIQFVKGLCAKHYRRSRKHGNPLVVSKTRNHTSNLLLCPAEGCNNHFEPVTKFQVYCSDRCRYRAAGKKKRESRSAEGRCPQCDGPWIEPELTHRGKPKYCRNCQVYFKERANKQKRPQ